MVTEHTDALVRGLNVNVSPTLAPSEALAAAHQSLAPRGAYAHAPTSELVVATVSREAGTRRAPDPRGAAVYRHLLPGG